MSFNDWKTGKLGDFLTLKRGYDLPQQNRKEGDFPIYSSSGLSGYHNEAKIKGPGVITGRYGTLGQMFYSDTDYWPHNTTLYVRDFKGNWPRFVFYFLQTLGFARNNDKTSVPGLNRNDLHEISVQIPTVSKQKEIASILSSLDDKIELNRQTNQTLEAMAQALFTEMCLPKGEGLPAGWRVGRLGDIMTFKNGKASPERNTFSQYSVYGANGIIGYSENCNSEAGNTVIGRVGSYCGTVYYTSNKTFVTENAIIAKPKNSFSTIFCFYILNKMNLNSFRVGSGQPLLNQTILSAIEITVPNDAVIKTFEEFSIELFQKIGLNNDEIQTLTSIRDSLLPKLMKGEIAI